MSTGAIIGIIIAVIVVVAIVVVAMAVMRRARLRRQFGPEYDRLAQQKGSRQADAELSARQKRVEALGIHELSPTSRLATAATGRRSRSGSLTPQPTPWLPRTR